MMISTLFTSVNVVDLLEILGGVGAAGLAIGLPIALRRTPPTVPHTGDRFEWRMPRLSLMATPRPTRSRRWLLGANGVYLAVAGVLLIVRFIQLATS
jgi:hypothetical protein